MPSMDKLSSYATTVAKDSEGFMCVTYHDTQIVRWKEGECLILNSGGWDTVTTRRKMNQAARQFDLPFAVVRQNGKTHVEFSSDGNFRGHNIGPLDRIDGERLPLKG